MNQREWEDYVAIRDRLNWLEALGPNNPEADKEYGEYREKLNMMLVDREDCEELDFRYKETLKRSKTEKDPNCTMCVDGWTKYGPCGCRSIND